MLNGKAVHFQVALTRGSEVEALKTQSKRIIGDLIKSDKFVVALGNALKVDGKQYQKPDMKGQLAINRVNRVAFAHNLLALLTGLSHVDAQKSDEEAKELVGDFFESLWNIPAPPEKDAKMLFDDHRFEKEQPDELEGVGSAGNLKRENLTLFDFIAPAKQKGKKKNGAAAAGNKKPESKGKEIAEVEKKEEEPQVPKKNESEELRKLILQRKDDPIAWVANNFSLKETARNLSKRIPSNVNSVKVAVSNHLLWFFF